MRKWWKAFKTRAEQLKQELKALRIALSEDLVPWHVKLLILFTVGYALSPIDLIPDFIPVLGLLDDLLIIPLLIYFILKLVPSEVMEYCREEAKTREFNRKNNLLAGIIIIIIWLLVLLWLLEQFFPGLLLKEYFK
ncbi:MAG: YkvA family protein [Salinimicrobium sp.]